MSIPKIKSSKFPVAPAGEHTFLVDAVDYVAEKNAVKVTYRLQDVDRRHTEYYRLDVDFQVTALGNMLRAAYNDDSIDDIDEDVLMGAIGRQFTGEIVHREWEAKTYAGINAFSYNPVVALQSFAKSLADIINDEEPNDEEPNDEEPVA